MAGGVKNWKNHMLPSACIVSDLVRAFGDEPFCTLCDSCAGGFDTHTTGQKHYQVVYQCVQDDVAGQVRYNLLDGELQVRRVVPLPTAIV
jgi:hypothetical protein